MSVCICERRDEEVVNCSVHSRMYRRRYYHYHGSSPHAAHQQSDSGRVMTMTAASLGALVTQSFVRNKARTASVLGLWILGFLIMNYLPAPYEVSPEMRREYNRIVTEEGRQDDVSMESIYLRIASI